jgi:hypothetical protein
MVLVKFCDGIHKLHLLALEIVTHSGFALRLVYDVTDVTINKTSSREYALQIKMNSKLTAFELERCHQRPIPPEWFYRCSYQLRCGCRR